MEDGNTPQTVESGDFLGVWTWNVQTEIVIACQDVCHYADIPSETESTGCQQSASTLRFILTIRRNFLDA